MAGTMPHAVLVELDWDGAGGVAAFAGELPGCATFASSSDEAVAAIPSRVNDFVTWLNRHGESLPSFAGGNWYEVERAAARHHDGIAERATFQLDDLPPSEAELARYIGWLELAREELAEALDRADTSSIAEALRVLARQDGRFAGALRGAAETGTDAEIADPIDALFDARDHLMDALNADGAAAAGARGVLRIAIADDLRIADDVRRRVAG